MSLKFVSGAGGGSKGSSRTPVEADDTLRSRQWANIIDVLCEGEIEGIVGLSGPGTEAEKIAAAEQNIFFDGVPLRNSVGVENFNLKGVSWAFVPGTQDQPVLQAGGTVASEVDVAQEVKHGNTGGGPVVRQVPELYLDAVRINLRVPRLTEQNSNNGDLQGSKVEFAVDVQSNGAGFVEVLTGSIEGKTTSDYYRSYELSLPGTGPWDIRVRRITPDATTTYVQNQLYWSTLTKILRDKFAYPNTALVGLRVDSSLFDHVPSRSYRVRLLKVKIPTGYNPVTREYPTFWDGTFDYAWTDNPAWCWYDLATNDRYGMGSYINASQVDKWSLYEIARYCDELVPDGRGGLEPRFRCNLLLQTREEALKVLMNMASIFRGIVYWHSNSVVCTQDRPSDPVKLFTAANVIDGQFTYSGSARQARHTVAVVTYNDPDNQYRQAIEYVEDWEGIARFGVREIEVTAMGCTSRGQANRLGKWTLITEREETDTVVFRTGFEGCGVMPGEVIAVSDPGRTGKRVGGRVLGGTESSVELDAEVTLDPGMTYTLMVVLPTGAIQERAVDWSGSVATNAKTLTLVTPLDQLPQQHAVWILSSDELVPELWRVTGMSEVEPGIVEITALEHVPGKYAAVEQNLKLEDRPTSNINLVPGAVTNLNAVNDVNKLNTMQYGSRVSVSWTPSSGSARFFLSWRKAGENQRSVSVASPSYDIDNLSAGSYELTVVAENSLGVRGPAATITHVVDASSVEPDVTGLVVSPSFDGTDCSVRWNRLDWATHYTLQVFAGATLLRQELLELPTYTYTYAMNVADGGPRRALTFKVKAHSWRGESANWATVSATNAAPATPSGVVAEAGPGQVSISAQRPADQDLRGMLVWMSTSSTVDTIPTNLVYNGSDNSYVKTGLEPGLPVYFRVAFYDAFGTSGLNVSSSIGATPTPTGGITKVTALPANPAAVSGQTAVFLDVVDTTVRGLYGWDGSAWKYTRDGGYLVANSVTAAQMSVSQLSAISANLGMMTAGSLTLDANGFVRGGSSGYMSGNGLWMGYHSGAYKMHVGNPVGAGFTWDGSTFTIRGSDGSVLLATGSGVPYAKVSGVPTSLSGINSTEATKLAGIQAGATVGADASNLNVGMGGNLLPNTEFGGGIVAPALLGWNPAGCTFTPLRGDDSWRPASAQCLEIQQGARNGNQWNIGADVYVNGPYGSRASGIPVMPGKRYEFSGKLAAHRADSGLWMDFFDANDVVVAGTAGTGWVTRSSGGRDLSVWTHAAIFAVAPAGAVYAVAYWRKSDTDEGQSTSFAWLCQPYFGEATAAQTVPSTYTPGVGRGAFANLNKIMGGNASTYIDNAAIGSAQIGSVALVGVGNFSVKSGVVGARMEMDSQVLRVFDSNGVLRVKLGNLDA